MLASQPYVAQYLAYFTALSPIGTSFKMKFIRTENGSEVGQETDFPADEFVCDVDLGEEGTGIDSINSDEEADTQREVYNLNGQRVAHAGKEHLLLRSSHLPRYSEKHHGSDGLHGRNSPEGDSIARVLHDHASQQDADTHP